MAKIKQFEAKIKQFEAFTKMFVAYKKTGLICPWSQLLNFQCCQSGQD